MTVDLKRRAIAEALGSAALLMAVVGSGIMAQRLTDDVALMLLCIALATGGALVVLVTLLGPLSGAHLNPAVTLVVALRRELPARAAVIYVAAQMLGAVVGTLLAHAMFDLPLVQLSTQVRSGAGQWLSEAVAAFGLLCVVLIGSRQRPEALPWLVGLYITSAYWFTASTSFANPAVTIARMLTDSFAGIRPVDAPAFIVAQVAGALLALLVSNWLMGSRSAA